MCPRHKRGERNASPSWKALAVTFLPANSPWAYLSRSSAQTPEYRNEIFQHFATLILKIFFNRLIVAASRQRQSLISCCSLGPGAENFLDKYSNIVLKNRIGYSPFWRLYPIFYSVFSSLGFFFSQLFRRLASSFSRRFCSRRAYSRGSTLSQ